MGNYARGYQLERECMALFKADGWRVIRGSSSKGEFMVLDTPDTGPCIFKPDLIASKPKGRSDKRTVYMVLIQCKRAKR